MLLEMQLAVSSEFSGSIDCAAFLILSKVDIMKIQIEYLVTECIGFSRIVIRITDNVLPNTPMHSILFNFSL